MFIVFEGTDGSGTSTQAKHFANAITAQGISVLHTVEPSTSAAGKLLREILTHQKTLSETAMQLLFFADRMHHIETEILPALTAGKTVIVERYNWSTLAYGSASGVDINFLKTIASYLPKPDITFFLDLSEEISLERIAKRGLTKEYFETAEILRSVRTVMQNLAHQSFATQSVCWCDAQKSPETISEEILAFYYSKQ